MKRCMTALACLVTLAGRATAQLFMVPTARLELDNERIIIAATDMAGVAFAIQSESGTSVGIITLSHAKVFADSMRIIAAARPVRAAGAHAQLSASTSNVSVSRTVVDSSDRISVSIDGSLSSTPSVRLAASPSLLVQLANAIDSAAQRSLELTGPERAARYAKELARADSIRAGTLAPPKPQRPPSSPEPPAYFEFQVDKVAAPMSDGRPCRASWA